MKKSKIPINKSDSSAGPLSGLRILAISQFGAGPFATQNLVDLGAEVIKIEDPTVGGDIARYVPPTTGKADSLYFQSFNRGKKSITIDLRNSEGINLFHRLVEKSDAVFNNLRGDLPAKLGITYKSLKHLNPALVTCSLSGFGRTGPRASEPGYDPIIQAMSGYMSITGDPAGPPEKSGVSIIDFAAGYAAAMGIVAGLLEAKTSGKGRDVDVSLFDTAVAMLNYLGSWTLNSEWRADRTNNSSHQTLVPAQNFQTKDGWISVFCAKEHFWQKFAELIDLPELISDKRFSSFAARFHNRELLLPIISEQLKRKTTAEWTALFRGIVPSGPVNSIYDALEDEQIKASNLIMDIEHPIYGNMRQIGSPVITEGSNRTLKAGPILGEHTDQILDELLAYDENKIRKLRNSGALG